MKGKLFIVFILALLLPQFYVRAYEIKSDYDIKVEEATQNHKFSFDAADIPYEKTPLNKFGRGVVNAATFWAEIPAEFFRVCKEKDTAAAGILGLTEGVASATLRFATGILDAVTFVIPPYDKPLMKPEYALGHADDNYRYYMGE